jgi:hypothetical protein
MLTAIEIENFKAFGVRQRIEFKPLTLLFGPNSGGKSSVSHALHYLRELLCEGIIDAHRTWSGGDVLDLGGVQNLVHGRVPGRTVSFRVEFTLDGMEIPYYHGEYSEAVTDRDFYEQRIRELVSTAAVSLEIDTGGTPEVKRLVFEVNGDTVAEFQCQRLKPHAEVSNINWEHPIFLRFKEDLSGGSSSSDFGDSIVPEYQPRTFSTKSEEYAHLRQVAKWIYDWHGDQAPFMMSGWGERSDFEGLFVRAGGTPGRGATLQLNRPAGPIPDSSTRFRFPWPVERHDYEQEEALHEFEALLSLLTLGPLNVLQRHLRTYRYVGPLRALPPRHNEAKERASSSRWASGVQAWESLLHGDDSLLNTISQWLELADRLDTGYRLERQRFKELPAHISTLLADPAYLDRIELSLAATIRAIPEQTRIILRDVGRNLQLHARDVGVGLSQIVPVLVALLEPGADLVSLEQPELHLHPRQQASLGDALIKAIRDFPTRIMVVETHSEHLILRLLRRVRETTEAEAEPDTELSASQVAVVYVQPNGTNATVTSIALTDDGDFQQAWPNGFFAERAKELF